MMIRHKFLLQIVEVRKNHRKTPNDCPSCHNSSIPIPEYLFSLQKSIWHIQTPWGFVLPCEKNSTLQFQQTVETVIISLFQVHLYFVKLAFTKSLDLFGNHKPKLCILPKSNAFGKTGKIFGNFRKSLLQKPFPVFYASSTTFHPKASARSKTGSFRSP